MTPKTITHLRHQTQAIFTLCKWNNIATSTKKLWRTWRKLVISFYMLEKELMKREREYKITNLAELPWESQWLFGCHPSGSSRPSATACSPRNRTPRSRYWALDQLFCAASAHQGSWPSLPASGPILKQPSASTSKGKSSANSLALRRAPSTT